MQINDTLPFSVDGDYRALRTNARFTAATTTIIVVVRRALLRRR